jgi:hypothetical protein
MLSVASVSVSLSVMEAAALVAVVAIVAISVVAIEAAIVVASKWMSLGMHIAASNKDARAYLGLILIHACSFMQLPSTISNQQSITNYQLSVATHHLPLSTHHSPYTSVWALLYTELGRLVLKPLSWRLRLKICSKQTMNALAVGAMAIISSCQSDSSGSAISISCYY